MKHIFIINPNAGKRDRTSAVLAMADHLRKEHHLNCECLLTQRPGHATELARKAAETGEEIRVYACGGDGTVYEVANGLAGFENAAMTCIPVGTGNDFLKNFGTDMSRFSDAENLWDGDVFPLDLINCNGKYCTTIACSGIDARVANDVHQYSGNPLLSGRGSYLTAVAANFLFKKISQHWTVTLDGEDFSGDYALCAVCNGRYYGGGSSPRPEARMNDGVLHTILIKSVSRVAFARLFNAYSAGNSSKLSDLAVLSTAKVIRLHSDGEEIVTCLDGECFSSQDVTISLADQHINFFGPKGCDCNQTAR
ncbi:MAG: YegS/Rv2252/BmrU family lipid kinase [Oscillibacter sp.]|jgi:YegS/Rv2252/BmrU family lipid kinase|nr:YegS/Rv2252/BmrU family lipid kinase [Oscillibacter sp.]